MPLILHENTSGPFADPGDCGPLPGPDYLDRQNKLPQQMMRYTPAVPKGVPPAGADDQASDGPYFFGLITPGE